METINKGACNTATQKGDINKNELVGYLHNVSPVKNGRYFNLQIQSKEKVMRGVCFSPPKAKHF